MPLDHYVSQVHLKQFYSPELGGKLMHVMRKSDRKRFPARSQDVCRIEQNSTNTYLNEERAIEEFLKLVEPRYDESLAKLRENKVDRDCIGCIAGFVSYVISCSPAGMRIQTGPLKGQLEATAAILKADGELEQAAPESLGGKSLTELLKDGTVHFDVDPKYPQALGISSFARNVSVFGNSIWEVLQANERHFTPFFSSDFPAAIEVVNPNSNVPINRMVPLAPDLAIRIVPDIRLQGARPDFSFSTFRTRRQVVNRSEMLALNRLIVQCAEDLVFFRDDRPWVEGFIERNSRFRIEPVVTQLPMGNGFAVVSTIRIEPTEDRGSSRGSTAVKPEKAL